MDIGVATSSDPKDDPEDFFDDLALWLKNNDFVEFDQAADGAAYNVALTEKGFAVLGHQPPGLDRPLGTKLKEVATSAGKDARSAVIASLIGAMVGGAINTLTK